MGKVSRLVLSSWLVVIGFIFLSLVVSSCGERLPGYNIPSGNDLRMKMPDGTTVEYFTGTIGRIEQSIVGPKITVRKEKIQFDRTFFVAPKTEIWLGINYPKTTITKKLQRAKVADLAKGQRVACFIKRDNRALRIHILER